MKVKEPITACPECGGEVWDNRGKKKTAKSPDWKCKDKSCDTPIWLEKPKGAPESNGHAAVTYTWKELGAAYKHCHEIANWAMGKDMSPEAIQAATATLFIQATRMGLKVEPKAEGTA